MTGPGSSPSGSRAAPLAAWLLAILCLLALPGCAGQDPAAEGGPADAEQAAEASRDDESATDEGDDEAGSAATAEADEKPKKRRERATSVTASPVLRGDLVIPVIAEGSIRARNSIEIKFEIGGHVDKVAVREGQRARRGQRLAVLDDREARLALEEANSRYLQALGQLAVEEEGYDSAAPERRLAAESADLARMEADGLITRRERLDRELELGMAAVRDGAYRRELLEVRSGLAAARADAARAELDLERTVVPAPFGGVVTELRTHTGERVRAGDTLCRLVDDVNVEAQVGVLESDLRAVAVGRPARLTIPALGETLPLEVDVVSPDVDQASRTCSVLLRLRSEQGRYKPGMFVRAAIAGETFPDRLLVPREAIITRDGRPVLFKVDGDRARWVYVKLGQRNDHVVEIARVEQGGPLEPGTLVVVDNHLTLTHDAKIKVRKTVEAADPWNVAAESE